MRAGILVAGLLIGATQVAWAGQCPGNPDALGTSRVLTVDPGEHSRIGTMQYPETLPLSDHEVVLTFDDGPLPPYTARVLDTLASECVKATFFVIGSMAHYYPKLVRRAYNEGHTIATHTQNHPLNIPRLPAAKSEKDIEDGIATITAVLGDPHAVAPFFRFPGLGRKAPVENYLISRGIMVWSADFPADDWKHISAQEVISRALERLEKKGKGVLLLHDIQPATALALPQLLRELKQRGYQVVHVVPAGSDRPRMVSEPQQQVRTPVKQPWPHVVGESTAPPLRNLYALIPLPRPSPLRPPLSIQPGG
jgi:peptidoglycan/xylan/chitin deacetylase (PgdA/CDA1 family)